MKIYSICRNNKPIVRSTERETADKLLKLHDQRYGEGEFQLVISDDDAPFYYRDAPSEAEYMVAWESTIDPDFDRDVPEADPETPLLPGQRSW